MGLEADTEGFGDIAFAERSASGNVTQPGDEHLLVKFYNKTLPDEAETKKEGRPKFHEVEYISIMVPGNKTSQVDRPASEIERRRFPQHYKAFKQRVEGEEEHIEGMPLGDWPGIVRSQVEELAFFGIKSVEQLANVSDSNIQGFMGGALLRERAKQYLASLKDNASTEKLAHKLREKDEEIAGLKATVAEMTDAIRELRAEMRTHVPVSDRDSQPSRRGGGADPGQ